MTEEGKQFVTILTCVLLKEQHSESRQSSLPKDGSRCSGFSLGQGPEAEKVLHGSTETSLVLANRPAVFSRTFHLCLLLMDLTDLPQSLKECLRDLFNIRKLHVYMLI